MSFDKVLTQLWMALPRDERVLLAVQFDLRKTGITEVKDDQVVSDGFTQEDLQGITREKMVEYVGSDESFPRLWELTVAKARYEITPPIQIGAAPFVTEKADEEVVIEHAPLPPELEKAKEDSIEGVSHETAKPKKHAKAPKRK